MRHYHNALTMRPGDTAGFLRLKGKNSFENPIMKALLIRRVLMSLTCVL